MLALVATIVLDRLTKIWVARTLPFEVPVTVIEGIENWFTLTYIHNSGAAFGLLPEGGLLFALVKVAVVIGLTIWYDRLPVQHFLVRLSIGMIMGGALGNLVDRLTTGYVVDFIHLHFWPIFNVADSSVSVGVTILAVYLLFTDQREAAKPEPVPALGEQRPHCG
ncbi:MAG: signal peptidase II [Anaerolineae bacterium]|nr:signal peptidase II [Anaerolineae bacterium]